MLLKVGSYGFLRFNLGMTPLGAQVLFPLLATLAVIGILYGALAALAQTDVKRLVAYSSVSHMGFIVLGLFSMNATGMDGAVIQMLNHGLTTGALFACVGVIYERYHTREMARDGRPLGPPAALGVLLHPGVAGLGRRAGPERVRRRVPDPRWGCSSRSPTCAVLASIGMILGAYYLLWMLQRVVFGPLREPHAHGHGHGAATAGEPRTAVRPVGWHEIAGPDAADGPDRPDRRLSRSRSSTGSGRRSRLIAAAVRRRCDEADAGRPRPRPSATRRPVARARPRRRPPSRSPKPPPRTA